MAPTIFSRTSELRGLRLVHLKIIITISCDCHRVSLWLIEIRTFLWYNAAGTLCVRLSIKSPPFRNNAIMLVVELIAIVELRCKTEIFLFDWKCNCVSISQQKNQKVLCSSMYRADWMSFELSKHSHIFASEADQCLSHRERHLDSNVGILIE